MGVKIFTDMELSRLKWSLKNHAPNWFDKDNLEGLVARLEAAELCAEYLSCHAEGQRSPMENEALIAWRKLAGHDEKAGRK